jgi:hypothetical protein
MTTADRVDTDRHQHTDTLKVFGTEEKRRATIQYPP